MRITRGGDEGWIGVRQRAGHPASRVDYPARVVSVPPRRGLRRAVVASPVGHATLHTRHQSVATRSSDPDQGRSALERRLLRSPPRADQGCGTGVVGVVSPLLAHLAANRRRQQQETRRQRPPRRHAASAASGGCETPPRRTRTHAPAVFLSSPPQSPRKTAVRANGVAHNTPSWTTHTGASERAADQLTTLTSTLSVVRPTAYTLLRAPASSLRIPTFFPLERA